jgi:hypothetical protein
MSYNVSAFYVAETSMRNRLKALLKPTVGILSGRNAPLIMTNDTDVSFTLNATSPNLPLLA